MKKAKLITVTVLSLIIVLGAVQFCFGGYINFEVEETALGTKLVLTVKGNKYQIRLEPYKNDSLANEKFTVGEKISLDKAKEIALKDAGLTEDAVKFKKTEMDIDNGIEIYEFEFTTSNGNKYEYEISADSGKILKMDIDSKGGKISNIGKTIITVDEAERFALKDAGIERDKLSFIDSQMDTENGKLVYEIEFRAGREEYEYTIDAVTGIVIERDIDLD